MYRLLQSVLLAVVFSATTAMAAGTKAEPQDVVNSATNKLFALAKAEQKLLQENPDAYFVKVRAILVPIVDFEYISKQVMGKTYWPKASAAQRKQFEEVFTLSLVKTYGKGIGNFAEYETKAELQKMAPDGSQAWVIQTVKRPEKISKVAYRMRSDGESWKAVNVVLEGAKLMETFRSQFAGAVERHQTIEAAIANWGAEEA